MPQTIRRTNFRVEVEPASVYKRFGHKQTEEELELECQHLKQQILRHVDDCVATICWNNELVCEFCGSPWTEEDEIYNGCCNKDDENAVRLGIIEPSV